MSTPYAYIICESSTEVVPSFEFQYRGCTKFQDYILILLLFYFAKTFSLVHDTFCWFFLY